MKWWIFEYPCRFADFVFWLLLWLENDAVANQLISRGHQKAHVMALSASCSAKNSSRLTVGLETWNPRIPESNGRFCRFSIRNDAWRHCWTLANRPITLIHWKTDLVKRGCWNNLSVKLPRCFGLECLSFLRCWPFCHAFVKRCSFELPHSGWFGCRCLSFLLSSWTLCQYQKGFWRCSRHHVV